MGSVINHKSFENELLCIELDRRTVHAHGRDDTSLSGRSQILFILYHFRVTGQPQRHMVD